jgi:hypothetical protein
MNTPARTALKAAVAASLGVAGGDAGASTYSATLTQVLEFSNNATLGAVTNISSSTATWSYDDITRLLTQTGGLLNVRSATSPSSTLYRLSVTGLVLGNGNPAAASTFRCTEGNFGQAVGASLCGNYSFGTNQINESTTSWGPGTAASRTLGGDDVADGPQLTLARLDGLDQVSWLGTTLILGNGSCSGPCTTTVGGYNNGYQWTLSIGPLIPEQAWPDFAVAGSGLPVSIPILANDWFWPLDTTAVTILSPPSQGGTAVVVPAAGPGGETRVTYTSAPGFLGTEQFTYGIQNGFAQAPVTVRVVEHSTTDTDGDGVFDYQDNCQVVANPTQCDTEGDGYGNRCDADLNHNGIVNAQDTTLFRQQLGKASPAPKYNLADLNCNGAVNAQDTTLFRGLLGLPPGPSALEQ